MSELVAFGSIVELVLKNVPHDGRPYHVWQGPLDGQGTSGPLRIAEFEDKVQAFDLACLEPYRMTPSTEKVDGIALINSINATKGIYPCGAKTFAWVMFNYHARPETSYLENLRRLGYTSVHFPGTILLEDGDMRNIPYMLSFDWQPDKSMWRETVYMVTDEYSNSHHAVLVFKPRAENAE